MNLFRKDGDLPEEVEENTPEVFAEPLEAAGLEDETEEDQDGSLYIDRILKDAV